MNSRTREDQDFADPRYGNEHGDDGNWLPAPCVICDEETQTRCAVCRQHVCGHHREGCPNGCDDPTVLPAGSPVARRLGTVAITCAGCGIAFIVEYRFSQGLVNLGEYLVECPAPACRHPHHPTLAGEIVDIFASADPARRG